MSMPKPDAPLEPKHSFAHSLVSFKESISSMKTHALRFFSGTALSRVTGMLRDMILAFSFGTIDSVAALFVAFRLSHLLRRLFGEGPLQSAFIPLFEELRKDSEERAFRFFRDLLALFSIILVSLVILIMIGLGLSLNFVSWSEGNHEIVFLMIIMMPSLIPICLYGVNMSLLQCQKQYFTPSIAPAAFNTIIALTAIMLRNNGAKEAMPYLAVAIVFACVMQWFVTFPATLRHMRTALKGKLLSSIQFFSSDTKKLLVPLSLGILGIGASQINNFVDAIFSRCADPEGPSFLWYGLRLIQLPLALFGIAISGALLPPLSRAIQNQNQREYSFFLEYATRRVTAFLLPCSILLLTFGTHIVNMIYGHGKFTTFSVFNTSGCLHAYAFGLLPLGFIIVFGPACYAHKEWKIPVIGSIISLITNLILNAFFIYIMHLRSVSMVALATSISAWLNIAYIYRYLEVRSGQILSDEGKQEFCKVVIVSLLAGVTTWLMQSHFWAEATFFNLNTGNAELLSRDILEQIRVFSLSLATFLISLFTFAWFLKAHDLLSFAKFSKEPINA